MDGKAGILANRIGLGSTGRTVAFQNPQIRAGTLVSNTFGGKFKGFHRPSLGQPPPNDGERCLKLAPCLHIPLEPMAPPCSLGLGRLKFGKDGLDAAFS